MVLRGGGPLRSGGAGECRIPVVCRRGSPTSAGRTEGERCEEKYALPVRDRVALTGQPNAAGNLNEKEIDV